MFMRLNQVIIATALLGAASLTGCASGREALGMSKVTPDEFRVVAKAPLVVPPDFALRPPAPGEPRPQELQPESAARTALIGRYNSETRSDGERLLIAKTGADKADPLVRFVIDDETGDLAHKDKSFADTVMFWKKDNAKAANANKASDSAAEPIDAPSEEARIKALVGTKPVIIAREKPSKIKLPGL